MNITQTHSRIIALLVLATTLFVACNDSAPAVQTDSTTPVSIVSVTRDSVVQPVLAIGTYGPRDDVPLAFKIGGVVARVAVDEGAFVKRGQVLATLDLREIDALVAKARAGLEKAARDEARLERLYADSVATYVQMQDARSAADAARADLASAEVNREFATIVAPSSGVILTRSANPGSVIAQGTAVLTLGSDERGRVMRVGLPDRDALRMHEGDRAVAHFDALPGKRFTGRVTLLGRSADVRTGTYVAEVSLDAAELLPAGLVGRVTLSPRASALATLVPIDALVEANADSAVIYTASQDSRPVAERHAVRILFQSGDRVAIDTDANDAALRRVITRGAQYLAADASLRIVKDPNAETFSGNESVKAVSANKVRP